MYSLTNEQKQIFWKPSYQHVTMTYEDSQSTTQTITQADILENSFVINRASSSGSNVQLGAAIMAELDFDLNNVNGRFVAADLLGKELYVTITACSDWNNQTSSNTVTVPLGYFTVDEVRKKGTTALSVVTFDRMARFDNPATGIATAGTASGKTAQWLVQRICTLCNVPYGSVTASNFANYTSPTLIEPDNWTELTADSTYRQILMWVLERSGAVGYIDYSGALRLGRYVNSLPTNYVALTTANRKSSTLAEKDVVITGLKATVGDNSYTSGTDVYRLAIDQNPFFTDSSAATLITNLHNKLNGYTYRPFTAEVLPTPNLEPCDRLRFTEADGTHHSTLVMNWTYRLNGATTLSATGETEQARGYASGNQLTRSEQAAIEKVRKATNAQLSNMELAATHMNELAANTFGYYMTEETLSDGSKITYWHDKPTLAQSVIIYKRGADGFFLSQDGGATYTQGFDSSGNAVLNILDAIGINADWVRTGSITSTSGTNYWDLDNGRFRLVSPDGYTDINLAGDSSGSYISVTDTTSYARATLRGQAGSLILSHSSDNGATYTEVGSAWVNGSSGASNANFDYYRVGRYNATTGNLHYNQIVASWDYTNNASTVSANYIRIRKPDGSAAYRVLEYDTTQSTTGTKITTDYGSISNLTVGSLRGSNGEVLYYPNTNNNNILRSYVYQVGNEANHLEFAAWDSTNSRVNATAGYYRFRGGNGTNYTLADWDSTNSYIRVIAGRYTFRDPSGSLYTLVSWDTTPSTPGTRIQTSYATFSTATITNVESTTTKATTFRTVNGEAMSWSSATGNTYVRSYNYQVGDETNHMPLAGWDTTIGTVVDAGAYRLRKVPDDGTYNTVISRDSNNNILFDNKTPVYTSTVQTITGTKQFNNTLILHVAGNYPELNFQGKNATTTGRTGSLTQQVTDTQSRFYFNVYHMSGGIQQNSYVDVYRLPWSETDNASHVYEIITTKNLTDIPDASATVRGMVSTGAQTFVGAKTFTGGLVVSTTATASRPIEARTDNSAIIFIHQYGATEVGVTTSASSDDYVKALIKTLCVVYPNRTNTTFFGSVSPNSRRLFCCFIYNTSSVNSTTGLPEYALGEMINWGGANDILRFNINSYSYTSRLI